jgi:dynein heavy chain 1
VLVERLRYAPIGYSKVYEFNEADQRCALDLIDQYVDALGRDRANIDPAKLPWQAIRVLLTQNIYGGKIDNEYDRKILNSLVEHLFTEHAFDSTQDMFFAQADVQPLKVPEAARREQFVEWIQNLPKAESPAWSGLPPNVEKILNE